MRIGREPDLRDQEESTRLTANHISYLMMYRPIRRTEIPNKQC